MPFPGGLWWLLCCRQGFTLLRRDYGEAGKGGADDDEAEESFELRSKGDEGPPLQVNVTQPSRASSGSERSLPVSEETHSLITEKKSGRLQGEPDAIVKGWLQREVRGGIKTPWLRPRKYWFVLTEDSLDYYSGCEVTARCLGSLVLTSLCSVLWPDKQTYKETGYWAVTVFGRKHCYRLYTEHLNEAVHWVCALQKVIISKPPVQTPTQLLMCDIEENRNSPEILDQIYQNNPILCYTAGPIYAPLLPFPYAAPGGQGYAGIRDEAVKLFHSLQQLEGLREPALLMQGVLQTCHDLPALVDEIYCQLVKQTTEPPAPGAPADLRYWQLLACMSCTFRPSLPVLCYLQLHLQRTESQFPGSEVTRYGRFIAEALHKTKGQEGVPSLEEITGLMGQRETPCGEHCPSIATCHVAITSQTTVQEVALELMLRLGLAHSPNSFALYEESWQHVRPLPEDALVADVLTRFESSAGEEPPWKPPGSLWFRHYGCLNVDCVPCNSQEFAVLFEQIFLTTRESLAGASSAGLWAVLSAVKLQMKWKQLLRSHCLETASRTGVAMSKRKRLQRVRQLETVAAYLNLVGTWLAFGSVLSDAEVYQAKEIVQHLTGQHIPQEAAAGDSRGERTPTRTPLNVTASDGTLPARTFCSGSKARDLECLPQPDTCSDDTSGTLCS